jgi:hypothetical protein
MPHRTRSLALSGLAAVVLLSSGMSAQAGFSLLPAGSQQQGMSTGLEERETPGPLHWPPAPTQRKVLDAVPVSSGELSGSSTYSVDGPGGGNALPVVRDPLSTNSLVSRLVDPETFLPVPYLDGVFRPPRCCAPRA